ncbi:MAG: hypothetical protein AAF597_04415 [Bacteroidota bacterium]
MRILLSTLLLLMTSLTYGQSAALSAARAALSVPDAEAQLVAFDSLLATGKESADLHLAIGNAYFNDEQPGKAILHYERGLRLAPGKKELLNNLKFVRAEVGINKLQVREFFLTGWWRSVGAALGTSVSQWLALLFWWGAVAGAVLWYLKRSEMDEKKRFALLPLAAVSLLLAILFYNIGSSRADFLNNDDTAVLTAKTADLRVAPGPDATLEETLTEGVKLRILDEFDGYVKVALEDGSQGYLPEGSLEVI